jgi:hypothetical protein
MGLAGLRHCAPSSDRMLLLEQFLVEEDSMEAKWYTLWHGDFSNRRARHCLGIIHLRATTITLSSGSIALC